MKNTIKLFHTGDFHLDSPFSGYNVRQSDMRRAELRNSFSAALSRAVAEECDIVLIAGDLFDCGYITAETVSHTFAAIKKCGLPVVVAPGNHDFYTPSGVYARRDKPENLFVFSSSQMSRLDFDELGVSIHGYAFTSEKMEESPLSSGYSLHPEHMNILLAHADIYSPMSRYAPTSPLSIEASGFEYAALGHIHKAEEPTLMGSTLTAYCGFPEGRGFDELGFGGALTVTLDRDAHSVNAKRVIVSSKRYLIDTLDVTGASSKAEVTSAIESYITSSGYGKETALRIILTGAVVPSLKLDGSVAPDPFPTSILEVQDQTSPVYDSDYLESDISLRGALYRELLPALRSDDPREKKVAAEALRLGLAALDGNQIL